MAPYVGIASNWNYPDYGGMLQAFATQIALDKMGWRTEMIDARGVQQIINARKVRYFLKNIFDGSILKEKGGALIASSIAKRNPDYREGMSKRIDAFHRFSSHSFRVSDAISTWEELEQNSKKYDLVLVGSDQLWLPSNIEGDYYTLSFVPNEVPRASYATSFGVSVLPRAQFERAEEFLKRFRFLSTREASGQNIILECIGREVPVVCDPTLLLSYDDWSHYSKDDKAPQEEYIFCYLMGDNPYQRRIVESFSQKHNLKIVVLPNLDRYIRSDEGFGDYRLYDVGPDEFLGLVRNASYVFTDSFHGTIFSCIFERSFFVFPRFTKTATLSTNTRIESLLFALNLQDHFIDSRELGGEDYARASIPDDLVCRIESFRGHSIEYLHGISNGL